MTTDPWGAVAPFLDRLTQSPAPAQVLDALMHGPLSAYGATSAALGRLDGDEMVLIATVGFEPAEVATLGRVPVSADLPICRAVRECTTMVIDGHEVEDTYADTRPLLTEFPRLRARTRDGSVLAVPAFNRGLPVAGYYFTCTEARPWSAADIGLLEGLGSAVALWLSADGDTAPLTDAHADGSRLSDRQLAILRLVAAGRTTTSIAAQLGYSPSTVKQEVRRAVHQLDAHDRNDAAHKAVLLGLIPAETP